VNAPTIERPTREQSLSVKKVVRILRAFTRENPELTVAELVSITKLPRTVCYRLIVTLEDEGLLERDEDSGRYRIGLELFRLGNLGLRTINIRDVALPEMTKLAAATEDVVVLSVESRLEALCVERVDGGFPIQTSAAKVGKTLPLHVGGGPFALLAFLPEEKQQAVLSADLTKLTSRTVVDPDCIKTRIEQVREAGFAVGDEDLIDHLVAIGAPIFDAKGEVAGSLSVGAIKARYPNERVQEVATLVMASCDKISALLGAPAGRRHRRAAAS